MSALILSAGFGLAAAGTIACSLRPCDNLIMWIAAVSYPALMALTMITAVAYYAGWGSWARRRLRQPLRAMTLLCCAAACAPVCVGSGASGLVAGALMLFVSTLTLWAAFRKDVTDPNRCTSELILTNAFMISSVLFVVVQLEYIHWSIFAAQIALLALCIIMCYTFYRQWAHAVWHIFMIVAACTHYAIVWQHLM